ncbi:MAG TPA: hypothetical protein VFA78_09915 [Chloroflexota bacterium]|nr:hypothetical protein [Chloroflexota bacterium]
MIRLIAFVSLLLIAVLPAAGARAAHVPSADRKLEALALRGSEVPNGYTNPHTRLYTHAVSKMTVPAKAGHVSSPISCLVPSYAATDGMRAGFIQGFSSQRTGYSLQVCAYSFATDQGAHAFFHSFATKLLLARVKMHLDKRMTFHTGDESVATNHGEATCSCSPAITLRVYNGFWRQGSVDVAVSYAGPPTYTSAEFLAMLPGVNKRLQ